jgi:hypothetical protein
MEGTKINPVAKPVMNARKVCLLISLKGDFSSEVAQNLSNIEGVNSVSLVSGGIDILCTCILRNTHDLFQKSEI